MTENMCCCTQNGTESYQRIVRTWHRQIIYPDRQSISSSLNIEPVLGFRHCTRAYTVTVDPACRPSNPQQWYWHSTVRQGSVRYNTERRSVGYLPFTILLYIIYLWGICTVQTCVLCGLLCFLYLSHNIFLSKVLKILFYSRRGDDK